MKALSEKAYKILRIVVCTLITAGISALGFYLLYRYEYISQFMYLDNFVGFLPVALIVCGCAAVVVLAWLKHDKKMLSLYICLAVVAIACFALFPNALKCNWWISYGQPMTTENEPDLAEYAPFAENNKLSLPDVPPEDILYNDLPQLDGAVALYPVYAALAQAFYSRDAFFAEGGCADTTYTNNGERVIMTNTLRAYNGLINGERDIIFVAGASQSQKDAAKKAGAELVFTPIGKEAFVFIVPKTNPIDNLSYQQIKNIYSGKTSRWSTLGFRDGGQIVAFQRPDGSGSQTGLQNIMGDIPLIVPQPLPDRKLAGSNSLMTQMTVTYKGVQPALGYSYKYFATTMYKNDGTKLLAINNVYPSAKNIKSGAYPFTVDFYAVTLGEPKSNVKTFIDYILSDAGQSIIKNTGYSPI